MATLNRTFSVKNGIDVANTIIVDSSRNLSNIVTANAVTVNANTYLTVAGLNLVDHTNNAYGQANTARGTANDAYGQANAAYAQANTGYGQANAAYAQANTARGTANDAYGQANAAYTQANDAFAAANTSGNTVRVSANAGSTLSNKQLNFNNTASIQVTVTDSGDGNANIVFTTTGAAVADAYAQANAAYLQANTAANTANGAYLQANGAFGQANLAYAQANAAYLQANNAYAEANIKLNLSGGSITGNLVVANYSEANTFISNSQNVVPPNLANTDGERLRLFDFDQAGHPNYAIGVEQNHIWMGIDSSANNQGFKWYGNTSQSMRLSGNGVLQVANSVIATQFLTSAGLDVTGQANAAYAQANSARDTANGAYAQANGAYAQANGAYAQANGAYAQANGAFAQANGAYAQANGAYGQANLKVASITVSGNGLAVSNATTSNNNQYTLSVNTASTTDRGTTILVDSATSSDTGNAATANAVKTAYDFANTKLPLTGGTITGDLNIDGDLYVSGNTSYINVSTYTVEDSLIYLAANNEVSDVVDIGFMGGKNTAGVYSHTGLARHAVDGVWYLFDGLAEEGHQNNIVDVANTTYALLKANLYAQQLNVVTGYANIAAPLTVTNNATFENVFINQNANIVGNLTVTGTTNYANTSQFNAAVNMASTLNVTGNTSLTNVAVNGVLTISSSGEGLTVANANVTNLLTVSTLEITSNTVTTSSSGQVVLDKFPTAEYTSAKYFVQSKSGSDIHTTEIIIVQDATNVWITEYGSIQTGPTLGTFSADISSGDVRLLFNAVNNVNTIRSVRYGIIP